MLLNDILGQNIRYFDDFLSINISYVHSYVNALYHSEREIKKKSLDTETSVHIWIFTRKRR